MPKGYQELTKESKQAIRTGLHSLIRQLADDLDAHPEAVATELFYRLQRHRDYGRNATLAHKNTSYNYLERHL